MKRIRVAILVEDLYQDLEVWYPYYRLKEAGVEAFFVGTGRKESFTGKYGYPLTTRTAASSLKAASLNGIIIPGGFAPDFLRRDKATIRLVQQANRLGKIIGAICHAGWLLCSADILRGKTMTCFFAIRDDVIHAGARYVDREVVQDGNLVTARQPEDLPIFMRTFLKALGSPKIDKIGKVS
ncbi:MAG: type 1 glutamine amidotransferase [Candidatus Omnitrophica bacterium]|nr:type 1 glutamine amidotransferase [Candidatus Omnitrophota bacterium]